MGWFDNFVGWVADQVSDPLKFVRDIPKAVGNAAGMYSGGSNAPATPILPTPIVPGPTETEVVAADLRLRRALAQQRGRASSVVTGGMSDQTLKLTLPTLIGTRGGGP